MPPVERIATERKQRRTGSSWGEYKVAVWKVETTNNEWGEKSFLHTASEEVLVSI